MTLREWIDSRPRGAQQMLAKEIGVSVTWMSQIVRGHKRISVQLANAIHRATDGQVSRDELRPDVFRLDA